MTTQAEQSENESSGSPSESEETIPILNKPKLKRQKKVELDANGNVIKKERTPAQLAALVKCREGLAKWKLLKEEEKKNAKDTASTILDSAIKSDGAAEPVKKPRKKKVQLAEETSMKEAREPEDKVNWKNLSLALADAYSFSQSRSRDYDEVSQEEVQPRRKRARDDDDDDEEEQPRKQKRRVIPEQFQRQRSQPKIAYLG